MKVLAKVNGTLMISKRKKVKEGKTMNNVRLSTVTDGSLAKINT